MRLISACCSAAWPSPVGGLRKKRRRHRRSSAHGRAGFGLDSLSLASMARISPEALDRLIIARDAVAALPLD